MPLSLPEIIHEVLGREYSGFILAVDTGTSLHYDQGIPPRQFLEFAKRDLEVHGVHGIVNALSNAKRAIDAETNKALGCFHLLDRRKPLPIRMALLKSIGFVTPERIFRRISESRNKLEHEASVPSLRDAEDAVDVAELFIEATDHILGVFPWNFLLYKNEEEKGGLPIRVALEKDDIPSIRIGGQAYSDGAVLDMSNDVFSASYLPKSREYLILLKLAVALAKNPYSVLLRDVTSLDLKVELMACAEPR